MEHKEALKETLLSTLKDLKEQRSKTEDDRWEACGYVRHRNAAFTLGKTDIPDIKLYDTAVPLAYRNLCDGIAGYLINPNIAWFKFITRGKNFESSDEIYGANDYLDKVLQIIRTVLDNSNFYSTTKLAIEDVVAQGTSAEMCVEDTKHGGVTYDVIDPQEFYIAEDEYRKVDTFYREYEMTAIRAKKKWGDALPGEVLQMINKGAGRRTCKFVHAIYPRKDAISLRGKTLISTEKPFASVHYSYVGDEVFVESGYDEFPVSVHRWKLSGNSPYGTSPVINMLPFFRAFNKMHQQYHVAMAKQVNPAIFAPESLKNRINLNPGAVNFANLQQTGKPEAIQATLDLNHVAARLAELEQKLNREMHTDLFTLLMQNDQQRTATEVREIRGEGLVLLSAIIGNIQDEKIVPLIIRSYSILTRSKILPPPPEELVEASAEGRVRVELSGPLAQSMQAYHQTVGITQGMQAIAGVQQLFPDAVINIDGDELMRQAATANGMPQKIIREIADVKKTKKKMQEQLQAQQELENAERQADIYQKMGKAAQGGTSAQQMMQGAGR